MKTKGLHSGCKALLASCQKTESAHAKNRPKFPCRRLFFGDSYMATTAARPMSAEEKKVHALKLARRWSLAQLIQSRYFVFLDHVQLKFTW